MGGEIDELTLARARRGDPSALSALIRHYQRPVYALVARLLVGRRGEAIDDVAQEAFLRVCRGLGRFEPGGSARLSTWILTVTTRACLNALRDGRRAQLRREETELQLDATGPIDPEQSAVERERRQRVEAAMAALPEEMRAVLVLRAYHDFDYDEIAAALGIELGTVKSRLGRARTALRETLADDERHEESQGEQRP
jgi:RNA polymerase sigma-70 factor (ECF subfamily)